MSSVGPLLSEFRKKNRLSQLELSLLADVSSRHISFIETGRTRPSRSMLIRLADVLNLTHKDSNLLLHSGGFTAAYSDLDLGSEEMAPVLQALQLIMQKHDPYPALVMDGNYNMIMANASQQRLANHIVGDMQEFKSLNILEAVMSESAFRPYLVNWETVAGHLLRRLRKQVLAYGKPAHQELLERLLAMAPPLHWQQPDESKMEGPMLTVDFKLGDRVLRTFSTLSHFGTALDIGMEELMIECYFPADAASREFFTQLAD